MAAIAGLLGCAGMAFCQWLIYFHAPVEATLGLAQKIFYIHLPLAWWALASFFVVFAASCLYIFSRNQAWDRVAQAAAEVGTLFCGLALLTGCLWAKKSWGVWWTWDPRLATTLVTWFVYAAYLVLRGIELEPARKRLVCAVVGIVAFLDVPLVFVSARIWRSIHPAVFASGGGMPAEMLTAILACVFFMGFFWWSIFVIRRRQLDMRAILDRWREKELEEV